MVLTREAPRAKVAAQFRLRKPKKRPKSRHVNLIKPVKHKNAGFLLPGHSCDTAYWLILTHTVHSTWFNEDKQMLQWARSMHCSMHCSMHGMPYSWQHCACRLVCLLNLTGYIRWRWKFFLFFQSWHHFPNTSVTSRHCAFCISQWWQAAKILSILEPECTVCTLCKTHRIYWALLVFAIGIDSRQWSSSYMREEVQSNFSFTQLQPVAQCHAIRSQARQLGQVGFMIVALPGEGFCKLVTCGNGIRVVLFLHTRSN